MLCGVGEVETELNVWILIGRKISTYNKELFPSGIASWNCEFANGGNNYKEDQFFVYLFQVCCKTVVLKLFTIGINSFKRNVTHTKNNNTENRKKQ